MKSPNHNPEIPDNHDQFQLLIETLPISLSIVTLDGRILYVNPKCREVFGFAQDAPVQSTEAFLHWVNPEHRKIWLEQITEKGTVQNHEMHLRTKAGKEIWVLGSGIFIRYQNQTCVLSTHQDVTDRIRVEKKLRQLTDEYQKVFLASQSALFLVEVCSDGKFRYLRTNNAHQETTGILPENISGKTPQELLGNATGNKITENYQRCVSAQKPVSYEEELDFPSGKKIWATTLNPVSEDGRVIYIVGSSNDITELKQTGQALRNSEENLRHFFDANIDFLWVLDQQATIVAVNQTVKNRLGYTDDEITGKSILMVHPENRRREARDIVAAMLQGERNSCPVPLVTKNGTEIPVETFILKGKWNNEPALFGISKDISQLKLSEEKFEKAFHTSPNIIGLSDLETGEYIEVNNTFFQILEYTKEDISGKKAKDLVRLDKGFRQAALEKLKTEGAIRNQETVIYTKTGRPVHVLLSAEIIKLQDKQYNLTTAVDIGHLKKAEAELIAKENRWRSIINTSPDGIVITSPDGTIQEASAMALKIYGYNKSDEVLGRNILEFVDEEYRQKALMEIEDMIEQKSGTGTSEYKLIKKDGSRFYAEINAEMIYDEHLKPLHIIFVERDITERKESSVVRLIQYNIARSMLTAKSLEELATFIRYELDRLLDTSNFFIATYNPVTERLKKVIFNDEKDDFDEWDASQSISGQVVKLGKEVLLDKENEAAFALEHNIRLTGSQPEAWLGVPIFAGNKPFGVMTIQNYTNPEAYNESSVALMKMVSHEIGVFVERQKMMTDLLEAKEKSEENNRLKSAFLANMSHEIRTPMNGILGFTDLLKEPGISENQRNNFINIIEKSGKRLLNLINDLIDISKIEAGQMSLNMQIIDFDDIIQNSYRFFLPEASKKNIHLRLNCEKLSETKINTDNEKFTSILTNLIKNAIKFTEKGYIEIGYKKYNQFIRFYVKDTGRGIPADKQQLIFERFGQADVSLSRNYEGAGLGLSISKAFAEMLGGTIGMNSQPGKGSEFYFTLPVNTTKTKDNIPTTKNQKTGKPKI